MNIGDYVKSTICSSLRGTIKILVDDGNFIMQCGEKKLLCCAKYYTKIY